MRKCNRGLVGLLLVVLVMFFVSGCHHHSSGSSGNNASDPVVPTVDPQRSLVSIEVDPTAPRIAVTTTAQLTATGIYSDNTTQDLTASVTWSSSNKTVADVSNSDGLNGTVTSFTPGSAVITATTGSFSGSTTLTVTDATLVSLEVTPTTPHIAVNTTTQFAATGIFSDGTKQNLTSFVTWASSDIAVAGVSNSPRSQGLASAIAPGTAVITATAGSVSDSTTLTVTNASLVSIDLTPTIPGIAVGTFQQFAAIGTFSDSTTQDLTASLTWSSSDPAVATVSDNAGSKGLVASVAPGSTVITASGGSISGSATLAVTDATLVSIDVSPADPAIALGTSQQFTATGSFSDNTTQDLTPYALWSSSSTTVATVSNAAGSKGLATSVGAGVTTITAIFGSTSGTSDLTVSTPSLVSIEVSPTDPIIPVELSLQFSANGIYSDGSVQDLTSAVTWASSNRGVAAISNAAGSSGLAVPVAPGSTAITASFNGVFGATSLTVSSAALVSISISPVNPAIAHGTMAQFTATGTFSDGTTDDITAAVTWSSSNSSVATVSNTAPTNGLATSIAAGTTTITASAGSMKSSTTLTVTSASLTSITITPANGTLFVGAPTQYTATGAFSDGTTQDLTIQVSWKSANKTIAAVSNAFASRGVVTAVKPGTTTITAAFPHSTITASTGVTVSTATLASIDVTPADQTLNVGSTLQFTATGHYSDGSIQNLTKSTALSWSSSNTHIATIANKPAKNKGLAKGVSAGSVNIIARMKGSISGTARLTVM